MPGIISSNRDAERAAAERAAREARERARRAKREKLQKEIDGWNGRLADVTSQIAALEKEKRNLETYMEEWEVQKRIYNGNDILSEVVIVNVFEGECADEIKKDFEGAVTEMDITCRAAGSMRDSTGRQVFRLNQYAEVINTNLASLRRELASV